MSPLSWTLSIVSARPLESHRAYERLFIPHDAIFYAVASAHEFMEALQDSVPPCLTRILESLGARLSLWSTTPRGGVHWLPPRTVVSAKDAGRPPTCRDGTRKRPGISSTVAPNTAARATDEHHPSVQTCVQPRVRPRAPSPGASCNSRGTPQDDL